MEYRYMDSFVLFKIFFRPLAWWLAAMALYFGLTVFVAGSFSESVYLVGAAETIRSNSVWVALIPFVLGSVSMIQQLEMLYYWQSDEYQGCDVCGAPQEERTGRYGPYRKCYQCGTNKRGWE